MSGVTGFAARQLRTLAPDLHGVKLAGLDLSNCSTPVKASLMNADFSGCVLHCAQMTGVKCQCDRVLPRVTSATDACLCGSNFTGADLTHAALPCDPDMTQGCMMRGAVLRYCHLPVQVIASLHSDLFGVTFSGLTLKGARCGWQRGRAAHQQH